MPASEDDLELLSLKLVAVMMYSDELKVLDCSTCTRKEQLNCSMNQDYEEQVYYHDSLDIDINTCPLNCIAPEHFQFFDRYAYTQEFPASMPKYDECDTWFWRLYKIFNRFASIIERDKIRAINGQRR